MIILKAFKTKKYFKKVREPNGKTRYYYKNKIPTEKTKHAFVAHQEGDETNKDLVKKILDESKILKAPKTNFSTIEDAKGHFYQFLKNTKGVLGPCKAFHGKTLHIDKTFFKHITSDSRKSSQILERLNNVSRIMSVVRSAVVAIRPDEIGGIKKWAIVGKFSDGTVLKVVVQERAKHKGVMSLYRIDKAQKKPLNQEASFEPLFPVGITPKASDILVGGGPNSLIISDFEVLINSGQDIEKSTDKSISHIQRSEDMSFLNNIFKSQFHKYIRKIKNDKGEWVYIYHTTSHADGKQISEDQIKRIKQQAENGDKMAKDLLDNMVTHEAPTSKIADESQAKPVETTKETPKTKKPNRKPIADETQAKTKTKTKVAEPQQTALEFSAQDVKDDKKEPETKPDISEAHENNPPKADESPRQKAKRHRKVEQDSGEYVNARKRTIKANVGEDLKGSARHKAMDWKGLAHAESLGGEHAEKAVTRDNLMKIYPHELEQHEDSFNGAMTALTGILALNKFPKEVNYSGVTDENLKKEMRSEYHDLFNKVKTSLEKDAKAGETFDKAISNAKEICNAYLRHLNMTADSMLWSKEPERRKKYGNMFKAVQSYIKTGLNIRRPSARSIGGTLNEIMKGQKAKYGENLKDHVDLITQDIKKLVRGESVHDVFGVEKKAGKGRTISFNVAQLYSAKMERKGPDYKIKTMDKAQKTMLTDMKIKGAQVGNSMTDSEVEHHYQQCAIALKDLTECLGLPEEMASFNGRLGIAFGARGHGNALAHYEPDSDVINLTRNGGVGSIAHEWGHFFDHTLFKVSDMATGSMKDKFASHEGLLAVHYKDHKITTELGKTLTKVGHVIKGLQDRMIDDFAKRDREGTETISREKFQKYWMMGTEVFARSFEAYVNHKLESKGQKNTYLVQHPDHYLWPTKEETKELAPVFDELFERFKDSSLLKKALSLILQKARGLRLGSITERKQGKFIKDAPHHWKMLHEHINNAMSDIGLHHATNDAQHAQRAGHDLLKFATSHQIAISREASNKFLDEHYAKKKIENFETWKGAVIDSVDNYAQEFKSVYDFEHDQKTESGKKLRSWKEQLATASTELKSDVERDEWVSLQFDKKSINIRHVLYGARQVLGKDVPISSIQRKGFAGMCRSIIEKVYEHGPSGITQGDVDTWAEAFKTLWDKDIEEIVPLHKALGRISEDKFYRENPKHFVFCCTRQALKNDGQVNMTRLKQHMKNSIKVHGEEPPSPDYDDGGKVLRSRLNSNIKKKYKALKKIKPLQKSMDWIFDLFKAKAPIGAIVYRKNGQWEKVREGLWVKVGSKRHKEHHELKKWHENKMEHMKHEEVKSMANGLKSAVAGHRIFLPDEFGGGQRVIAVHSNFPKWFHDVGARSRTEVANAVKRKKGKLYDAMMAEAHKRLLHGYQDHDSYDDGDDAYMEHGLASGKVSLKELGLKEPSKKELANVPF